eukprot:scaffold95089_cov49-Phaeocystis_antarctica.AAC.1
MSRWFLFSLNSEPLCSTIFSSSSMSSLHRSADTCLDRDQDDVGILGPWQRGLPHRVDDRTAVLWSRPRP